MRGFAFARAALLAATALAAGAAQADEGMWTLDNVPLEKVEAATGFKPDAKWLEKVRLSSVRLAGGCSGSFVSGEGLVMTNHHCVTDCLAELSTAEDDLMADGFLAQTRAEERSCAGIEVNQLVEITDVTDRIAKATDGTTGEAFATARRAAMAEIEGQCAGGDANLRCDVVTLYQGGQYHLYRYKRFQDVRLAFAPEHSIAAFGGDPDNFNFPRYSLDMSLLRVYGADGNPISSPDHFNWSKAGAEKGDAAFVTGHPGSTSRLDTLSQLAALRDSYIPETLMWLSEKRGRLAEFGRRGPEEFRISQEQLQGIENGLKVWRGRQQALADQEFFSTLVDRELELRQKIAQNPELRELVGDAYGEIEEAAKATQVNEKRYMMLERGRGFDSDLFRQARTLVRAAEEASKPNAERLREFSEARLPALKQRLSNPAPVPVELEKMTLGFSLTKLREAFGPDHALVKAVLGKKSPEQVAEELVSGTRLGDPAVRLSLFEGGKDAIAKSDDPMIALARLVDEEARAARRKQEEYDATIEAAQARIAQARFAVYGDSIYPDATFSLRLSFGRVQGWTEPDGTVVEPFTTYAGLFDRVTGAHPFALPESWQKAKDRVNKDVQYNAVSTNDIIGGNSGSPLLNSKAEVIGLVFDGNIHSLSGEYGYEPKRNRSVWVDVRGMAEALRSVYRADHLLTELGVK
ncbi:S46 family peptidase [Indioceanicola profundi]|uniref:S46 family peptidase n=1 Tax=Indioceanicola profundi TaxID=2220096 RepID=UPI000E6AD485|nr:S46 family peptidase [Indioceanicola profundi]